MIFNTFDQLTKILIFLDNQRSLKMNKDVKYAVLFDFDGVVVDSETQYTQFWDAVGEKFLGKKEFGRLIKGTTMKQIIELHFHSVPDKVSQLEKELADFEQAMSFDFIPGFERFIKELHTLNIPTAVVTSSDQQKMKRVYKVHPDLPALFDAIFTAEDFSKSKPDPDCFLIGMKYFNVLPENTFVIEDSLMGLKAGTASGAVVIGLTTTLPKEEICHLADATFSDFSSLQFDQLLQIRAQILKKNK